MASSTNQSTKASTKAKKTLNDEIIFDTTDADILCGKEKHCVSHPGSLNFRAVIDKYASKYQEAVTKQEKMNVTKEIYDLLGSQNSRFLKFNASAKGWEQLSSLLARDKISHALRFANREKKPPSASKPSPKKGHRRTGSDSTVTTAATELSIEDFDYLLDDNEPLDWSAEATADSEPKPYAYPVYESAPPTPPPAAYEYPSYGQPHPQHYYHHRHYPHAYGHGYYHPQSYHHSYHHHQPHYAHAHAPHPMHQPMPQHHHYETMETMSFPEKPLQEAPARETSMDVDLSDIMTEPLMDFDLE